MENFYLQDKISNIEHPTPTLLPMFPYITFKYDWEE